MADIGELAPAESSPAESSPTDTLPPNLHIITYASRMFAPRIPILNGVLARIPGIKYRVYTEADIPAEFISAIGEQVWQGKKGAGFMCWKAWIVKDYLSRLQDGNLLIYMDAGCTTNLDKPRGRRKLMEYLALVNNPANCGMLRYELPHLVENKYTNRYFWDYMCARYPGLAESNHYNTPQLITTVFFIRKCQWVVELFDEAVAITLDNPELLSEIHTQPGEIHRHDQSLLSVLYKVRGGDLILPDKTYPRDLTFKERCTIPFLATRLRR